MANTDAGWSSLVARRAHNPKVVGSNPAPATKHQKRLLERVAFFVRVSFVIGMPQLAARYYQKSFRFRNLSHLLPCFALSHTYLTQLGING
ncbi:hypothetical protein EMIT0P218_10597 [Pseudomonas sp. IT-P218]